MVTKKYNIVPLLLRLYRNRVYNEAGFRETDLIRLKSELIALFMDTFPMEYDKIHSSEESLTIDDDISQLLANLVINFGRGKNEVFESGEENRIIAYILKTLQSIIKVKNKGQLEQNNKVIFDLVKKLCDELYNEGKISVKVSKKEKLYYNPDNDINQKYDGQKVISIEIPKSLYKNNSFNRVEIKKALMQIFLENYYFSISDLVRILSGNSDLEIFQRENIADINEKGDNIDYVVDTIEVKNFERGEQVADDKINEIFEDDSINMLMKKLGTKYKKADKLKEDLFILYLYYEHKIGFVNISKIYFDNDISKSTVELRLKSLLALIKEISLNHNIIPLNTNLLLQKINKKYNFEEKIKLHRQVSL